MLDAARGQAGYLQLLERPGHAQILRAGQVRAARACPGRVMILHLVRLGPAHRRSRRAGLLAPLALGGGPFRSAPLPPRRLAAGLVIEDGGIDEFPLLRDAARSIAAIRSRFSSICARSSAISASRAAQPAQSWPGGGRPGTGHDHATPADSKQHDTPAGLQRTTRPPQSRTVSENHPTHRQVIVYAESSARR